MIEPYYQQPSELGLPILKLFVQNPTGECRWTIYIMERKYNNWGWNMSNVLKYLWRLGVKTQDTQEDLNKTIKYLRYELEVPRRPLSVDMEQTLNKAIEMCEDLLN
jgi:predicted nucleic acid-binding protein